MVRTPGVMDLERKKQSRSRQRLDLVVAEIALVKVQCRSTVQLEQHVSFGRRDPSLRSEDIPATGGATTDLDRTAIESDRSYFSTLGRAIEADHGFDELRTVASQPSGHRSVSDVQTESGDQSSAVRAV